MWLTFVGANERRAREGVVQALTRRGIETDPAPAGRRPAGPGLLLFDRADEKLFTRLQEVSRNGAERVLAIAFDQSPLRISQSWRLLRAGASDVFAWNAVPDPAALVAARFDRWAHVDRLVRSALVKQNLVGRSPQWMAVLQRLVEIAHFTTAPVLITGESGTGKELAARLIHTLDGRAEKSDLVVLDCTTIVPELSGSEFFGHERGAFTNAVTARDGAFAQAHRGTLFLDEVGELAPKLQTELLRAVQEKTYKRLGSNTWRKADFRLVCATHRDLRDEVAAGTFRHDFYHRLAAWVFRLPSLEERREDIPILVEHFLRQATEDAEPPELDPAVRAHLLAREYPGNVRELRQLVLRIGQRHTGEGPITLGVLPEDEWPTEDGLQGLWRDENLRPAIRGALANSLSLKEISNAAAETAVSLALEDEDGNLKRAAHKLGVTERALQMRRAARRAKRETEP